MATFMNLRDTLNLPDPTFTIPMKADLGKREPEILARWQEEGLYERIQEGRKDAPLFVLHDGPPYTNSLIHIGTALNKVLKDFVVKSRSLMGYRAPYVPGFDNHGLPIEQSVVRALHEQGIEPDTVTLRKACREHAAKFVRLQSEQFQRLGVFGMWDRPYTTMEYRYEAEIVRIFKRLLELGFVYRGLRPTLWSPTSRTALADTEIVYADHTSQSIFVSFPLKEDEVGWSEGLDDVSCVIWTTTPWTIPANLAVAFNPALEYAVVKVEGRHYVLAKDLVGRVAERLGWENPEVTRIVAGASFEGTQFRHPIFDRASVGVLADYVSVEEGTGVVHTAPGHGRDDFNTGVQYGLPILCPVDERGILTEEAGEFAGVSYKDCDTVVVDRLRELGRLLKSEPYVHSYPHSERDGKPVIFRATEQWFIGIDVEDLRGRMVEQVDRVDWLPQTGRSRIRSMVENRPDWCISRQRPWGVGIPILYGAKSKKPVTHPDVIENIARAIETEGSDVWFEADAAAFVPPGFAHPETGETEFVKETDVLDVWFDSGCTSLCVLEGAVEPRWRQHWPADVYLEGSDQHRGWFNSSLVIATAIRGEAPYRAVITHGFVVDEMGRKMSKRLGNVVDPQEVCDTYGADVLRYWVASVNWENDVPCGDQLLKQVGESYRRVRNTLRFLLGNLFDYDGQPVAHVIEEDHWMLERLDLLADDVVCAYERYDFGGVISAIHNFCVNELSSFYLDAIKDRMYCDGADWESRRSGQWACSKALLQLCRMISPLLPFTAEEVWARIPADPSAGARRSVHFEVLRRPSGDRLADIQSGERQRRFAAMLEAREWLFAQFEGWKAASEIKDSQDVIADLALDGDSYELTQSFGSSLANFFKFSEVRLTQGPRSVAFSPSPYLKCERSRIRRPDVAPREGGVPLSDRDWKAVQEVLSRA
ncbi:MAG: isoleucine--tRNA ligase [Chthonomonadaceae bacterium]|nr:MAG: isoleucine--tRNA ligase 1 [Armatimonadota bacterium]